jgi:hypothetical protein
MIFLPDSRAFCFASSKSPFVSCSAFLHSIIGSPVSSRSFMTIAAVISAMGDSCILRLSLLRSARQRKIMTLCVDQNVRAAEWLRRTFPRRARERDLTA